ncbi:MAG: DUF1700 domain-containing protein [Sandaracinaceae bacterium]|jgi:uncharacterized membrane protein|nr:DUF1700 domain-containing protein [Sandaracinaceae bacterium]
MSTETLPSEAETFLRQLRAGLASLPRADRDDIIAEVRSHLYERHAAGKTPLLEGFENAQSYASRFAAETALRGALARGTSVDLGKALLTGATTGISMLLVVVPLAVAYMIAVALVLAGALKPIMPTRVGLFVDMQDNFVALGAYGGDMHLLRELLGFWAMPLFVLSGIVLLWICNRALRLAANRKLLSVRCGAVA